MRSFRHNYLMRKPRSKLAQLNVVPYIDVLLVLLIIFMVTIPMINSSVKVKVPTGNTAMADAIKVKPLTLTINKQREFFLDAGISTSSLQDPEVVEQAAAALQLAQQRKQDKIVMLRADQQVHYQDIMRGIMLLKQAGAKEVSLVIQPKEYVNA